MRIPSLTKSPPSRIPIVFVFCIRRTQIASSSSSPRRPASCRGRERREMLTRHMKTDSRRSPTVPTLALDDRPLKGTRGHAMVLKRSHRPQWWDNVLAMHLQGAAHRFRGEAASRRRPRMGLRARDTGGSSQVVAWNRDTRRHRCLACGRVRRAVILRLFRAAAVTFAAGLEERWATRPSGALL